MTQPPIPMELETAIIAVYRGPLDPFVSRRDALVKELRTAKRREDADRVKLLRKPSRLAWVLDNIADEDDASIEQLTAAIRDAQRGTDMRAVQSVHDAQKELDAAEREAQARRAEVERARQDAEEAASAMRDAERAVAVARARVTDGGES